MSLTTKLLVISCLIVSVLTLVQAGISAYGIRTQIIGSITSSSTLYGKSNARTISEWLNEKKSMLNAFADSLNRARTTEQIISQIKTTDMAGGFGSVLYGTIEGDTYREKGLNTKANYDPRIRPWYKNAVKVSETYLSEPYTGASSGILITTVSRKIVVDGKMTGVAMATLPLEKINEDILSIKVPGDGFAFLLSSSKTMISHPDKEFSNKPFSELTQDITAGELIRQADNQQLLDIEVNGTEYLTTVSSVPGTNWYLVLMSTKSVLLKPVQSQLMYQLVTALIMIIVSIVILSVALRYMLSNLREVSYALEDIAQGGGDLTVRINARSRDEVGHLAESFNLFVQKLQDTILVVNQTSHQVLKQSELTAGSSNQRQRNVSNQLNQVTMVATAMTEMATTTGDIARNAEHAAQSAQKTVKISHQGTLLAQKSQQSINRLSEEVQNASAVIEDLNQQGEQITTIVSSIDDIAEQTNLLALNAAIEAARAGEQGRGFAVVADEVRNLSQRTRTSTEEISQMITQLQETTSKAVRGMEHCHNLAIQSVEDTSNAATSFKDIEESTIEITNMATQIATAAEQQAVVSNEVNSNTESIKTISDQLCEDSVEGAKQAEELNQLSAELLSQVGKFKI